MVYCFCYKYSYIHLGNKEYILEIFDYPIVLMINLFYELYFIGVVIMKWLSNKKGFTMLELNAVISTLAALSVIAVNVGGNVLNDAKVSADKASTAIYQSSIEKYVASYNTSKEFDLPNGGNGKYPDTAKKAVHAIVTFSNVEKPIPMPNQSGFNFYYNLKTHKIVCHKDSPSFDEVKINNVITK